MPEERSLAARVVLGTVAVLAAVLLAMFAAGPVHHAIVGFGVKDWAFARTFRYLLLGALLVVPLVSLRPWRDVPRDLFGLRGPRSRPWLLLAGAALSIVLLLLDVLGQAAAGWMSWAGAEGTKQFRDQAVAVSVGAALGGLAEEVFFRGWLFTRLSRGRGAFAAAAWTAGIFAVLHAFRGTAAPKDLTADASGAARALGSWGANLIDVRDFGPRFVGLVGLSLLLTAAYLRSGSLWLSIGIHGGAILFMKQYAALTKRDPEDWNWAGSKWLYDGVPAWVLMAILAWILWPRSQRGAAALRA